MNNTPNSGGRKRTPISGSGSVRKTEKVSANGPVGRKDGYAGRRAEGAPSAGNGPVRSSGGISITRLLPLIVLLVIAFLIFRACSGGCSMSLPDVESLLGDGSSVLGGTSSGASFDSDLLGSLLGGYDATDSTASESVSATTSTSAVSTTVSNRARDKYTTRVGGGKDEVTVMVYLCGTDLESENGMGTADLNEMLHATIDDERVNVIVETGGAKKWNNSVVSNKTNQLYRVTNSGLQTLNADLGRKSMVDPSTLSEFIQYCAKNYPADRYCLILWDHGGGAISGYGYDQYFSGSMTLDKISKALSDGGVKFDFIGFDACLMATLETALVCEPYADYLIASEESEPGCGWYYTNWLTELSKNTSTETVTLAKTIIDDFNNVCRKNYGSCNTTLSIIDLSEFAGTVPEAFASFSKSVGEMIESDDYETVSDARHDAREYGTSSKVNHVDLVDLANRIGTNEAKALVEAIKGCVKYNRTSTSMAHSYGVSIYFPYSSFKSMSSAVKLYDSIGMDAGYTDCIKSFSSLASGGQLATGSTSSPIGSLLGQYTGQGGTSASSMLEYLLGGSTGTTNTTAGIDATDLLMSILGSGSDSWFDRSLVLRKASMYDETVLTEDDLILTSKGDGYVLQLSQAQWNVVQDVRLNVFVDDGEGYLDLGLDAIYSLDNDGDLLIEWDGAWIGIDGHVVAFYMEDETENNGVKTYTGRVPALLDGQLVNLYVTFENDVPRVIGYQPMYADETDTVSKSYLPLRDGDVLTFVCDYFDYDGNYSATYQLADPLVVSGTPTVTDMNLTYDRCVFCYALRDIYGNTFWTESLVVE